MTKNESSKSSSEHNPALYIERIISSRKSGIESAICEQIYCSNYKVYFSNSFIFFQTCLSNAKKNDIINDNASVSCRRKVFILKIGIQIVSLTFDIGYQIFITLLDASKICILTKSPEIIDDKKPPFDMLFYPSIPIFAFVYNKQTNLFTNITLFMQEISILALIRTCG